MSFYNRVGKLRRVIESCGGFDNFVRRVLPDMIEGKDGKPAPMPVDEWSLREIHEAVNTSQFPVITGQLISKKIMDAYREYPGIADRLVTPMPSKLQIDKIPGLWLKGDLEDIEENGPYPHSGDMEEEYVTIAGKKRGMILDITEEMVTFDQTGAVMIRAARMGQKAARDREKKVLYTVQDATVNGRDYHAWYPGGTRTALYSASNRKSVNVAGGIIYANQITDALEDYTDLDAADALLAKIMGPDGEPVLIEPVILLTSRKLRNVAERIIKQQKLPNKSDTSVGYHQDNPYYNKFEPLASPYVDKVSDNDWYLGDFKRQFVEKKVFGLQLLTRKDRENEYAWERDVVASYKVRHWTQPAALDHRQVIKSTGGS